MSFLENLDTFTIFIGIIIILIFVLLCGHIWTNSSLPPGPRVFPLIGNVPQKFGTTRFHLECLELRKQYGDVVHLRVGGVSVIIVLDDKLIRDALQNQGDKFAFRPNWLYVLKKVYRQKGIIWNHGETWERLRDFTSCPLRHPGGVTISLESRILEEYESLFRSIELSGDKPMQLQPFLSKTVTRIVCGITFGARYDDKDPDFLKLTGLLERFHKQSVFHLTENFMPWTRFLPLSSAISDFLSVEDKLRHFMKKRIQDHKDTFDEKNIRDLIDLYLNPNKKDRIERCVSDDDISRTIIDLLYVGPDLLTSALMWALLYISLNTDVQKKCRKEITEVVGAGSVVKLADQDKLPYVRATINEVLRIASPVPMGFPYTVSENMKLGEFAIPRNSVVLFHLHAAHNDITYWKNPHEFCPERFLDRDGNQIHHECFFPFSIGPMACVGEDLALTAIFLVLSNLLYNFNFKHPDDTKAPSVEGVFVNSLRPMDFDVCVSPVQ